MTLRNVMGPGPVGVAAAGRTARDIEQILGREGQTRERSAGASGDPEYLARNEGAEIVADVAHGITFINPWQGSGAGSASTSRRSRSGPPSRDPASGARRAPSSPGGAAARRAPRRRPAP